MKKLAASSLVIAFILTLSTLAAVLPTSAETSPTFNASDWSYNQSGTVTASGECGNLSDYQVRFTLHYGSGTSSGSDFYLGGLCQPDFDDVRFTRADGVTLLDYWMEEVNAGVSATVWVEFDSISTADTDFYIYYGNPNASSASDGDATFMFFDDFEDGVVDTAKWTEIYEDGGDWVKEEGGVIEVLGSTSGFGNRAMIRSEFIPSDVNVKVHSSIRIEDIQKNGSKYYDHFNGIRNEYYDASMEGSSQETALFWRTGYMWHNFDTWLLSVAWDLDDVAEIPALDATYHDLISWIEPGKTCHTVVDGTEYSVSSTHPFNTSQAAYLRISLKGEGYEDSDGCIADVFADYVFARKYCDPEPTIDWGEEPIPTPTATATATETPAPTFNASDWAYNQSGTVTASGECGNLSDYQVRLNLHYGAGTSSGGDFYLGGLCQPDFGDVRFTRADGATLLDYWMEKGAVNPYNDSVFWVEFDQISTAGTEFYIYYGNPNASSASDGEATWDFFDDFDGTEVDIAKWDEINSPNGTVADSALTIIKTDSGDFTNPTAFGYATKATFDNCRMLSRGKTSYSQTAASAHMLNQYNAPLCRNKVSFIYDNVIKLVADTRACNGSNTINITNDNFTLNMYYTYYYVRKDADYIRAWENGEFVGEVTTNIRDANDPGAILISFYNPEVRTQDMTVDWFGVGNYCDPEPTLGWGEEPTPTPTATATEPPAPAFNASDWTYNQSGTVTASGECGNLSDYQVRFTLHYGSGTSSGSDFYLGGLCQPDFDDVRFTRADGVTLLDYWMEEVNAGVSATVWVEFDQISTAGTQFYIYYGNPNASSASDGDATFMFFDDFEDGVVDTAKWTEIYEDGGDWVKEEGGVIEVLGSTSGFGNRAMIRSEFIPSDVNVKVHSSIRIEDIQKNGSKYYDHFNGIRNEYYDASMEGSSQETALFWRTGYMWHNFDTWLLSVAWDLDDVAEIPALDATYHDLISWIEPGKTCHTVVDGTEYSVSSTHPFNTSQAAYLRISLKGEGYEDSNGCIADVFADYVFARKYCDPEPTVDWGEGPIPTPTPTASATSTPEVVDVWIDFVDSPGVNVTLRAATNSEFIVRTNISGVEDLKIAQYDITYDPGVVHVQKVSGWTPDVRAGKIGVESFPVMSASFVPQETRGRIRVIHNLEGVQGVSGSGYMSSIYFKVVGSPRETTPIEISIETLDNVALQPIPHNTTNSSVLVVLPWQAGDANLDSVINAGDITKAERIILGWDAATNLSDANVDGAVNASDIGVIEYKILEIWPWDHVHIEAPDSAACGTDFFATLYVNYIDNFGSAGCEVTYDSGILELVGVTGGELQEVSGTSSDFQAVGVTDWGLIGGPGRVRINSSIAGGGGASGAGYLARLRFHVDGSAWQASPIAFNGSESWLRNALGGDIAVTWEDDWVTVAP